MKMLLEQFLIKKMNLNGCLIETEKLIKDGKIENSNWAELSIPEIDYNSISYFSAPKKENIKV